VIESQKPGAFKGASAQENICLIKPYFGHLHCYSRLKYTQVFLRVCAAQLSQNKAFQVQGSFAKADSG